MTCQKHLSPTVLQIENKNSGVPAQIGASNLPSAQIPGSKHFPGRTAIARKTESLVARKLIATPWLKKGQKILDWGCGRGADVQFYQQQGLAAVGFDPNHGSVNSPEDFRQQEIGTVTCCYVLNVVSAATRQKIVQEIADFLPPTGQAFFAVRTAPEIEKANHHWQPHEDGWLTQRQTFQKGFSPPELTELLKPYFSQVQILEQEPLIVRVQK